MTSTGDDGPGSLRAALRAVNPRQVRFAVDGTVRLTRPLAVPADKTLDARGANVTITGHGLQVAGASNVVVTGLRFAAVAGDALAVTDGASKVWVHGNAFTGPGRGVYVADAANEVTVSRNRFTSADSPVVVAQEGARLVRVTVAHNAFVGVGGALNVRGAWVHAAGNTFDGFSQYAVKSDQGAQVRSQGNRYTSKATKKAVVSRGLPAGRTVSIGDVTGGLVRVVDTYQPDRVAPSGYPLGQLTPIEVTSTGPQPLR